MSSFTHPYVIQTPYDFLSSVEHKRKKVIIIYKEGFYSGVQTFQASKITQNHNKTIIYIFKSSLHD